MFPSLENYFFRNDKQQPVAVSKQNAAEGFWDFSHYCKMCMLAFWTFSLIMYSYSDGGYYLKGQLLPIGI